MRLCSWNESYGGLVGQCGAGIGPRSDEAAERAVCKGAGDRFLGRASRSSARAERALRMKSSPTDAMSRSTSKRHFGRDPQLLESGHPPQQKVI